MKKERCFPLLGEVDEIVINGTIEQIQKALVLTKKGKKVAMIVQETYLGSDICAGNAYQLKKEQLKFFPSNTRHGDYLFPDKGKLYLEALCETANIDIVYGVTVIDILTYKNKKLVCLAAKGGVFFYLCGGVNKSETQEKEKQKYRALLIGDKEPYELLEVTILKNKKKSLAENLYFARGRILRRFAEEKKKRPNLSLGRFAERIDGETEETKIVARGKQKIENWTAKQRSSGLENQKYIMLEELTPMEVETFEIVVVGGGTAGAMAALHAARNGANTVLIEPMFDLGGTGTIGGVSTYWFGNRFLEIKEIDERIEQIYDNLSLNRRDGIWSKHDDFHAGIKGFVLLEKCLKAGVKVVFGQMAYAVEIEKLSVKGVLTAGCSGNRVYEGNIIIDATGDADIAAAAGAQTVYGNSRDCITYWASLAQYTSAETYQNNFSSMVITENPVDMTRFIKLGRKRGEELFDHGSYVSVRESRHLVGEEVIDLRDICMFSSYEDAVCTFFSNYDPKGKLDADMIYCGVLPPQVKIQIPLRSMIPLGRNGTAIKNLYVIGKAISATHNAFPSLRMQADLMHQGAVMGMLAAKANGLGCPIEIIKSSQRREWIFEMSGDTLVLEKPIRKNEKRTQWIDVPFTYTEEEMAESLEIMCMDSANILPHLKQRIKKAKGQEKIRLMGYGIWHGCKEYVEEITQYLMKQLEGDTLPVRKGSLMCVQTLPDHGAMPEIVYLLNSLAWVEECPMQPFKRVMELLQQDSRDYKKAEKGIFHYIESFAYVAERTGKKEFLPFLHDLVKFKEFEWAQKEENQTDVMSERLQILNLSLYRALARLLDPIGLEGLKKIMHFSSLALRRSAAMELEYLGQNKQENYIIRKKKW